MVSQTDRSIAAELMLKFYRYQISASDMESEWPEEARDRAVQAIGFALSTMFVSDGFLVGPDYADPELYRNFRVAKFLHRCLMFLNSDFEYEWRELGLPPGGINLEVLFAHILNRPISKPKWAGDDEVWPFFRHQDYRRTWKLGKQHGRSRFLAD
jgi:hypothetical protein